MNYSYKKAVIPNGQKDQDARPGKLGAKAVAYTSNKTHYSPTDPMRALV